MNEKRSVILKLGLSLLIIMWIIYDYSTGGSVEFWAGVEVAKDYIGQ